MTVDSELNGKNMRQAGYTKRMRHHSICIDIYPAHIPQDECERNLVMLYRSLRLKKFVAGGPILVSTAVVKNLGGKEGLSQLCPM
jgi:hypothetical protein